MKLTRTTQVPIEIIDGNATFQYRGIRYSMDEILRPKEANPWIGSRFPDEVDGTIILAGIGVKINDNYTLDIYDMFY